MKNLEEICGNCGHTYGSHYGGSSPWPYGYCPDPDCRMNWEKGPGTVFKPTGKNKKEDKPMEEYDTDDYDVYATWDADGDATTSIGSVELNEEAALIDMPKKLEINGFYYKLEE